MLDALALGAHSVAILETPAEVPRGRTTRTRYSPALRPTGAR